MSVVYQNLHHSRDTHEKEMFFTVPMPPCASPWFTCSPPCSIPGARSRLRTWARPLGDPFGGLFFGFLGGHRLGPNPFWNSLFGKIPFRESQFGGIPLKDACWGRSLWGIPSKVFLREGEVSLGVLTWVAALSGGPFGESALGRSLRENRVGWWPRDPFGGAPLEI